MAMNMSIVVVFIYTDDERKRDRERKKSEETRHFIHLTMSTTQPRERKRNTYPLGTHFFRASHTILELQAIMLNNNPTSTSMITAS